MSSLILNDANLQYTHNTHVCAWCYYKDKLIGYNMLLLLFLASIPHALSSHSKDEWLNVPAIYMYIIYFLEFYNSSSIFKIDYNHSNANTNTNGNSSPLFIYHLTCLDTTFLLHTRVLTWIMHTISLEIHFHQLLCWRYSAR